MIVGDAFAARQDNWEREAMREEEAFEKETEEGSFFGDVIKTRLQRNDLYGNTRVTGHRDIGLVWTGIINSWLYSVGRDELPEPIPDYVAATMMVGLKCQRIASAPNTRDSYIDAANYAAIAEECYKPDP